MSRLTYYHALLKASADPFGVVNRTVYDDRNRAFISYTPEWSDFDHDAFYQATLSRLGTTPAQYANGSYPGFTFPFTTTGQPDEGFDICGILEAGSLRVSANGVLLSSAGPYGGGGPTDPPILSVRVGIPGLPTRPGQYTIRVERVLPEVTNGNGLTFYLDYLIIYSR